MGKYLLDNIHAQYPKARLGIVVASRGTMIKDLLASSPHIEVIEANRRSLGALWRLWREWRGSDMVATQYTGKHGGQFGLSSKVAARLLARQGGLIGFHDAFRWNGRLYDHLLPVRHDQAVAEHERAALRASGLAVAVPYPKMESAPSDDADRFGLAQGTYAIAHFFAGNPGRSMSPERARTLVQELHAAMPNLTILVSGGSGDRASAKAIVEDLSFARSIAGEASLQDMLKLIKSAAFVVSVDTGVAHLAAHLHTPLVVMRTCLGPNWWLPGQYGPGIPAAQFSREELCRPHVNKPYPDCIDRIVLTDIVAACEASVARIQ